VGTKHDAGMNPRKPLEKTPLDDQVIFVSSEGIKSLETAIEHLERVYKELAKAAGRDSQTMDLE
jgi:hypothetical protein